MGIQQTKQSIWETQLQVFENTEEKISCCFPSWIESTEHMIAWMWPKGRLRVLILLRIVENNEWIFMELWKWMCNMFKSIIHIVRPGMREMVQAMGVCSHLLTQLKGKKKCMLLLYFSISNWYYMTSLPILLEFLY